MPTSRLTRMATCLSDASWKPRRLRSAGPPFQQSSLAPKGRLSKGTIWASQQCRPLIQLRILAGQPVGLSRLFHRNLSAAADNGPCDTRDPIMQRRPSSVGISGWLIVIGSAVCLSAVGLVFAHRSDPRIAPMIPPGFNYPEMFGWPLALLGLGAAILAGMNWARVSFLLLCGYSILEAIFLNKAMSAIAGRALIALVIAAALFGRSANDYFGKAYL